MNKGSRERGVLSKLVVPLEPRRVRELRGSGIRSTESTGFFANLIARIASGDDRALAEFYDSTKGLVFGLVRRILDNPSVAEEITLDIYVQVWRQAKRYDANRAAPRTWLLMIARSRAIDSLRSDRREICHQHLDSRVPAMIDQSLRADELVSLKEWQTIMRTALDTLTQGQREAIELAFYCGMSHSAIASKLSKPLGTVKSHIRFGMLQLRRYLESYRSAAKPCRQCQRYSAKSSKISALRAII